MSVSTPQEQSFYHSDQQALDFYFIQKTLQSIFTAMTMTNPTEGHSLVVNTWINIKRILVGQFNKTHLAIFVKHNFP